MSLDRKQKKYIKKYLNKKSLKNIAANLSIPQEEIEHYLKKRWGNKKFSRFKSKINIAKGLHTWAGRVENFHFKPFLKANLKYFILFCILVFASYINSFGNEFVSDDVGGVLQNPNIGDFGSVFSHPPGFFHSLTYFMTYSLFGRSPAAFRMMNILFHLVTVVATYVLIFLLSGQLTALFSAAILAVHPLEVEAVSWISGGIYVKYSFFVILGFVFLSFAMKTRKNNINFYILSTLSFLMALFSSEKAMALPLLVLAFILVYGKIKKDWKKLIAPFILGGVWILIYLGRLNQRITDLTVDHYSKPQTLNPLAQIPVAISSYLQLIFWPFGLTLYHSEMHFSTINFIIRFIGFLAYIGLIIYGFIKHKKYSFWLAFLIIALSPTLTPFGVSWIVAERYVYLGAIGIFVFMGIVLNGIAKKYGKKLAVLIAVFLVLGFSIRTIVRNIDWKNQDNLWLAAAKTSPNSPQNHNNLGDLYARRGDFPKAAEHFKKAIALKPGYADAFHNLANVYRQMGNNELALENYQTALKYNPRIWQSHQNLAAIYFDQKNLPKAEEHMKKAVELDPKNAELQAKLAYILIHEGKNQEAGEVLGLAIQLDPNNKMAQELLSQLSNK